MSVDQHRHCQKTVLSAIGLGNGQQGLTWDVINNLNGLNNLPSNWKNLYSGNTEDKSNITYDFASTIKLINNTASELDSRITNIDRRVTIIEGQTG